MMGTDHRRSNGDDVDDDAPKTDCLGLSTGDGREGGRDERRKAFITEDRGRAANGQQEEERRACYIGGSVNMNIEETEWKRLGSGIAGAG